MSEQERPAGVDPDAATEVSPPAPPPIVEETAQTSPGASEPPPAAPGPQAPVTRRLTRSRDDRVIAGVCGGIAEYLRIDAVLVRIAALVLVFAGGAGLLLYLIGWIAMPEAPEREATAASHPVAPAEDGERRGAVVLGLVFVALGAFFLLDEVWPDFLAWRYVWPVALIAVGLALVLRPKR